MVNSKPAKPVQPLASPHVLRFPTDPNTGKAQAQQFAQFKLGTTGKEQVTFFLAPDGVHVVVPADSKFVHVARRVMVAPAGAVPNAG